jgi:hypothetical protein
MQQAKRQVQLGLRKGLCDLLIVYLPPPPSGHVTRPKPRLLFLEMKREKGGTVSPEQRDWINTLNKCETITAKVAKGFDEAKRIIDELIY